MGLAEITLFAAIAYFVTSRLSRRPGKENAMLQAISKGLGVIVLILAAAYFYERFTG